MHLESHKTGRVSHSKFYYVKTDYGQNGRRDYNDQFDQYSTLFIPGFHVDN